MVRASSNVRPGDLRRRGSVYVLVLGASLIVALIGVSALMAARVQRRVVSGSADMAQARQFAGSVIDLGLFTIRQNPLSWRAQFAAGTIPNDLALGTGTLTLTATDPVDGNLTNNITDPVVLTGVGKCGDARYMLEVTLNGDGTINPGTWKRVVN
jgi:Tfp pilus assembly protein PilX